ncbi:tetratricopeptide repeat protein [Paractinoplanes globisporus]|uniref:Tetratricopeptide repeat protein n=1 Tax=Paractinoplanes globisporus TaxID=113565 RepID=A0ABW6W635_9ACTN|nr:tetratricopeptide repeat protein [Actinoplanes globisporus]
MNPNDPAAVAPAAFGGLPDPASAAGLDELVQRLRSLKAWAGQPSYEIITRRINAAWTNAGRPAAELARRGTVVDCFKTGRHRVNADLMIAVVEALHPEPGYVAQWRQALRVISGESQAAAQIRAQDSLPDDLPEFTGRAPQIDDLVRDPAPLTAIEGMAGVGKTRLAIHAGHLLAAKEPFDRVLFVNLRGFHPDPAQPPADPGAVLDSFLRLLGVPGRQVPHDLGGRSRLYRSRLAGLRALVVLDNAFEEGQVEPLLSDALTLVTSRRCLALPGARHLAVEAFSADESVEFLARVAPGVPLGEDPDALGRVARRCGHLPLALGLVAGHIRTTPGWTVADHADRLDERHRERRLDSGVSVALSLSYLHLPPERRRLLRLLALHPGQDIDVYASAALAGIPASEARGHLVHLAADHLLQQTRPGRYVFHDLVRAFTSGRASDEDSPRSRRAALSRLFDHYLAVSAAAMDVLHPAEKQRRPTIEPPSWPAPVFDDPDAALAWLDAERATLVAVSAADGWPTHAIRLSLVLFRYLNGGHHAEALAVHGHARSAAQDVGDIAAEARALSLLGATYTRLGRYAESAGHLRQALRLFARHGDPILEAPSLTNLGHVEIRLGEYAAADAHFRQALDRHREAGNRTGEARALTSLGMVEVTLGRYAESVAHHEQALALCEETGDAAQAAEIMSNLGYAEIRLGRHKAAADHLSAGLAMCRRLGNRTSEGFTLDCLGMLATRTGRLPDALDLHRQALTILHEAGDQEGEAWAHNGLGEASTAAGHFTDAVADHTRALSIATEIGDRDQQARAHAGLGQALSDREHYLKAISLYTELGDPEGERLRSLLD